MLIPGQIINNYRDMCRLLEENIVTSNSKKAQLKEWQRYFSYEKDKQKFIITKVYDTPKPKDIRKGNNSIYIDYIELLLMNYLSEQDESKYLFSTIELLEGLAFANNKYFAYKNIMNRAGDNNEDIEYLLERDEDECCEGEDYILKDTKSNADCAIEGVVSAIRDKDGLEVERYDINNFFARTHVKFQSILESALKSLRNRCLIDFEDRTFVVSEIGGQECHSIASEEDRRIITESEKRVLDEMGFAKKNSIYLAFKGDEFNKKVRKILKAEYDIKYYYKRHNIVWLTDAIKRTIPTAEIELNKKIFNEKVINAVNREAVNKYKNRELKLQDEFMQFTEGLDDWGDSLYTINDYTKDNGAFRYKQEYIDNQISLASYFLET